MHTLLKEDLLKNPFDQFAAWMEMARHREKSPEAMCLSTVDGDGFPNGRFVLLRQFDQRGFVFYTDTRSVKGKSLSTTRKAAITFYWATLDHQVRVQGTTEQVSDEEADRYFQSRSRMSRIASCASIQSEVLEAPEILEKRVNELVRRYMGKKIPRPAFWTGFRIVPLSFEFWNSRPYRLHDRFLYVKSGRNTWTIKQLYP